MTHLVHILGGDRRMKYAAEHLRAIGWDCRTCAVEGLADSFTLPTSGSECRCWLLPYPAFRGGNIIGTALPPHSLLPYLHSGVTLVGGLLAPLSSPALQAGARVVDVAGDEALAVSGAIATAEGALGLAISQLPCTLFQTSFLVIGYGRIGRILSGYLHGLGADVTVAARRERDRAMSRAAGMKADILGQYRQPLHTYRCIFNTVPSPVLSAEQISHLREDCIVIDLASAPYGIRAADVPLLGARYHLAAGLPGKTAPESAGIQYAEAVVRALRQEEL